MRNKIVTFALSIFTVLSLAACTPEENQLIIKNIWPDNTEQQALKIAQCESNFDENAVGPLGELGLFQIYYKYHRKNLDKLGFVKDDLYNPVVSTTYALELFKEAGWKPWTCRKVLK